MDYLDCILHVFVPELRERYRLEALWARRRAWSWSSKRSAVLWRGPRHRGRDVRGRARRGLRLPRAQRRRQDDDDPHAARPAAPDQRHAPGSSGSTAGATASRSAPGSATCPATSATARRRRGREALRLLARLRGIDGLGRAEALAERFRADLDRPLGQLSRGNRQKVGLILATFHEPELLILDEPTSGLDPLMQEEFLALVGEERERGCAVFISSHELDEVERVCDRVGIVRGGRLVAVERIAELLGKARAHGHGRARRARRPRGAAGARRRRATSSARRQRVTFKVAGDLDPVDQGARRHHVADIELDPPDARGGLPHLLREEAA